MMTSLLIILFIIYNHTGVHASEPSFGPTSHVIDFEQGGEDEDTFGEGNGDTEESQSSQDSAKDFVSGEGTGNTSVLSSAPSGGGEAAPEGSGSSPGSPLFGGQSGKEALDELTDNNEPDILGEGYRFGDDILQTDQTTEGFFQHIYNKTWEAFSGVQKIFAVIVMILFIVCALMTLISIFGKKEKVLWYAFSMLLCLIILIMIVYAPQIAGAFEKWFLN